MDELGALQCFLWRWEQTAGTPLCKPRPSAWWQKVWGKWCAHWFLQWRPLSKWVLNDKNKALVKKTEFAQSALPYFSIFTVCQSMVTGDSGVAGAAAARHATEVRWDATGPVTTLDLLMVGELVEEPIHRFRNVALQTVLVSQYHTVLVLVSCINNYLTVMKYSVFVMYCSGW